jgi:hypothetical protein
MYKHKMIAAQNNQSNLVQMVPEMREGTLSFKQVVSGDNHLRGYLEMGIKWAPKAICLTCFEIWTQSWFSILQCPADS